jgi:hypothetical protein
LSGVPALNLSANDFSGALPSCFGESERLEIFDASRNRLSGALPATLGGARGLRVLRLNGNAFSGAIPAAWGELAALRLAARAPEEVSAKSGAQTESLEGLQTLDLSNNRLSGAIPASLGNLTALRELRLNDNELSGDAPSELARLQRLVALDARRNRLSDMPSLREIPRLDTLRLEGNRLQFDALERQFGGSARFFTYAPQTPVLPTLRDTVGVGDAPLLLRYALRGERNRYLWLRNGEALGKSLGASLGDSFGESGEWLIPALGAADTGVYVCRVSNTLLPDLTLESGAMRVDFTPPQEVPQTAIRLLSPEAGEVEVPRAPRFAWTSIAGATSYTLEVSLEEDFSAILARRTLAQSAEALKSGVVRAFAFEDSAAAFALPSLTRTRWRVRATNSRGDGAWSRGEFTTTAGDAALGVSAAHFGKVPLGDSARRFIALRNVSSRPVVVRSLALENADGAQSAKTPFRVVGRRISAQNNAPHAAPGGVAPLIFPLRLLPGENNAVEVEALFAPRLLSEARASIVAGYIFDDDSSASEQMQRFAARLTGRGGAVKLIPPKLDTLLVGLPTIAAAQAVNVSGAPVILRRLRFASSLRQAQGANAETPYALQFDGESGRLIEAGDTLALPLRAEARTTGALEADELLCEFMLGEEKPDTASAALRSFARLRASSDVVVRFGARVKPERAAPGR